MFAEEVHGVAVAADGAVGAGEVEALDRGPGPAKAALPVDPGEKAGAWFRAATGEKGLGVHGRGGALFHAEEVEVPEVVEGSGGEEVLVLAAGAECARNADAKVFSFRGDGTVGLLPTGPSVREEEFDRSEPLAREGFPLGAVIPRHVGMADDQCAHGGEGAEKSGGWQYGENGEG